jgi:hypothetical protein
LTVVTSTLQQRTDKPLRVLPRPARRLRNIHCGNPAEHTLRIRVVQSPPEQFVQMTNQLDAVDLQHVDHAQRLAMVAQRLMRLDVRHPLNLL